MSVHFRVGDVIASILHLHTESDQPLPPPTEEQRLLIACYRSGQIEESTWQEHLDRDSDLAVYFDEAVRHHAMH